MMATHQNRLLSGLLLLSLLASATVAQPLAHARKQTHNTAQAPDIRKQYPFLPPEMTVSDPQTLAAPPSEDTPPAPTEGEVISLSQQGSQAVSGSSSVVARLNASLTQDSALPDKVAATKSFQELAAAHMAKQQDSKAAREKAEALDPTVEQDLNTLWRETLVRNPVVRFSVGHLTTPADLGPKRSSLFVSKTLNALIQGATLGAMMLPGGGVYRDMTVATVGQAFSNLATRKLAPQHPAARPLSQTEQIQLAQLVDGLKLRLTESYLDYRNSASQLARCRSQSVVLRQQYQAAKEKNDAVMAMMLGSSYHQARLKELEAEEALLTSEKILERLAGPGILSTLAFQGVPAAKASQAMATKAPVSPAASAKPSTHPGPALLAAPSASPGKVTPPPPSTKPVQPVAPMGVAVVQPVKPIVQTDVGPSITGGAALPPSLKPAVTTVALQPAKALKGTPDPRPLPDVPAVDYALLELPQGARP